MARNNLITVRTGSKAAIKAIVHNITDPTAVGYNNSQILGEPFLATDSKELFIGNGGGSPKVISPGVCVEDFDTLTPQNRATLYVYAYDTSLAADAPRSKKIALSELLTLVSNNSGDTCKVKIGLDTDTSGFLDAKTFGTNGVAISTSGTTNKMLNFQVVPDGATLSVSSSGIKVATGGIALNELATGIDASSKSFTSKSTKELYINSSTAPTLSTNYAGLYDSGGPASNILWSSQKITDRITSAIQGMSWVNIDYCNLGAPNSATAGEGFVNYGGTAAADGSYYLQIPATINNGMPGTGSNAATLFKKTSGTWSATTTGDAKYDLLFSSATVAEKVIIVSVDMTSDVSNTSDAYIKTGLYFKFPVTENTSKFISWFQLLPAYGVGLSYTENNNTLAVLVEDKKGLYVGASGLKVTLSTGLAFDGSGNIIVTDVTGGTV